MSLLWAVRHYTGAMSFNKIQRVIARWENISKFTEWGWHWDGGWLLELTNGKFAHMHAFKKSAQPWEDEGRVFVDYLDKPGFPDGYAWIPYSLERTHVYEVDTWREL